MIFDDSRITWRRFANSLPPDAEGRHPSDGLSYWVLGADTDRGIVDILFRLAPGAVCQPHCHLGPTATFVVAGSQQNYTHQDGHWTVIEDRPAGFFTSNNGDHTHREGGGPDGAIVHLTMTAVNGVIWHVLDDHDRVVAEARLTDFNHVLELQGSNSPDSPRSASGL